MSRSQGILVLIGFLVLVVLHIIGIYVASGGSDDPPDPPDPVGVWQGRPAGADNWCIALCLGVNVPPPQPDGSDWPDPDLTATQFDVINMEALFHAYEFDDVVAWKDVDGPVNVEDVEEAIRDAGSVLKDEDLFVIFYSGHGGGVQVAIPEAGAEDQEQEGEEDASAEFVPTWCFSDKQLHYRELSELLTSSFGSTRVVVLSDSCYAAAQFLVNGDFQKPPDEERLAALDKAWVSFRGEARSPAVRSLSPRQILQTHWAAAQPGRPIRPGPLDGRIPISVKLPGGADDGVKEVNRIIVTASEEEEKAQELPGSFGLFTNALISLLDNGEYDGAYYPNLPEDLQAKLDDRIENLNTMYGDDKFDAQTVSTAYRPSETSPFAEQTAFTCREPDDPDS